MGFDFIYSLAKRYYHLWYYNTGVWQQTTWMGVQTYKSPMDMWNYQEILVSLQPSVVIEFGTWHGGSALFFSSVMQQIGLPYVVVSVDITASRISERTKVDPNIQLLTMSSASPEVRQSVKTLRQKFPGPAFAILDSDHSRQHVLAEMLNLRDILVTGDYLVVEDSNINGHPVAKSFGPGPYEAIQEYFRMFPQDYDHDFDRERKFGFSFAPNGFLHRR
ncbi:MAG TPA: CmcI family methyltransferase [Candidatus Polarisedimenticolia bacterium]|jgi:cephalosporin hydroxylase|nr:CmcI family methyltransferase [Candidatus Polarisedimenticolia bacterium]